MYKHITPNPAKKASIKAHAEADAEQLTDYGNPGHLL